MLKPQNRLKKNCAFSATYKQRRIFSDAFFTIYLGRALAAPAPVRIGFVVSNKIHKRATRRNRLKRLMRESFRLILKENALNGLEEFQSIVVVAKEPALTLTFGEVDGQIKSLLEKFRQAYIVNHKQP